MEKRSISLKKILIDMARLWYLALILALAGAFICWYSVKKYNDDVDTKIKAAEEAQTGAETSSTEAPAEETREDLYTREWCEGALSESELQAVLDSYALYQDIEERKAYMTRSLYMNMDPYHFVSDHLQFRVIHEVGGTDLQSYVHALKLYITCNDLAEELVKSENLEVGAAELGEMILVSDGEKDAYDDFLMVTVYQSEVTSKLSDAIKNAVIRYGESLALSYSGFSVELVKTSRTETLNNALIEAAAAERTIIAADQAEIDAASKKFGRTQKVYYQLLVENLDEKIVEVKVKTNTTSSTEEVEDTKSKTKEEPEEIPEKKSMPPMIVVGFVGGLAAAFLLLLLYNLMSGRLLFPADFSGVFGLRTLGLLREQKKTGVAGALSRAEYPDAEDSEAPAITWLSIREAVTKMEIREVLFVETGLREEGIGLDKLKEMAQKAKISMTRIDGAFPDADAAEQLVSGKGVIFVGEMHRSKLKEIDRLNRFCKENNVPVIGALGLIGK